MAIPRSDSELTMADRDLEKQAGAAPINTTTTVIGASAKPAPTSTTDFVPTTTRDFDTSAEPAKQRSGKQEPLVYPTRTRSRRGTFGSEAGMHVGEVLEKIPTALQPALSFLGRIHHFTFAWYTVTMSTAGISLLLIMTPHQFPGLAIIGLCVFLLALFLFLTISTVLLCRFLYYKGTFTRAATRPREALFVSTFFLSIAALLTAMSAYGSHFFADHPENLHGLQRFLLVVFWIYLAVTFVYGILQYHMLFSVEKRPALLRIDAMTPAWILPVFPVMLAGTLASAFIPAETNPTSAAGMALAGLASQGLGMLISVFMFSTYLSRLMAHGLPHARPAMFMAVGPPSFTCAALLGLANDAEHILRALLQTMPHDDDIDIITLAQGLRILALVSCAFLWGLSFWFLCMAVAGCACGMPDRKFHLSWWSLVFPNVGFVVSCNRMAEAVGSPGLSWFATVMMVVLVIAWLSIAAMCTRAVYTRQIVWPGHDEDAD